jgi:hypothetical protein
MVDLQYSVHPVNTPTVIGWPIGSRLHRESSAMKTKSLLLADSGLLRNGLNLTHFEFSSVQVKALALSLTLTILISAMYHHKLTHHVSLL